MFQLQSVEIIRRLWLIGTRFLLLAAIAGMATAQVPNAFSGLSTNRDGSLLLFSSPLRLRGSANEVSWEKIFSWTATDGVRLFSQKTDARFEPAFNNTWEGHNYYHLMSPSISSDGRTVAITG